MRESYSIINQIQMRTRTGGGQKIQKYLDIISGSSLRYIDKESCLQDEDPLRERDECPPDASPAAATARRFRVNVGAVDHLLVRDPPEERRTRRGLKRKEATK